MGLVSQTSFLEKVNTFFQSGDWHFAIHGYIDFLLVHPELANSFLANLEIIKNKFRNRSKDSFTFAVFCWNTANNALGRAETIRAIYQRADIDAKLVGCLPYPRWHKIWPPLADKSAAITQFELAEHTKLLSAACQFVLQHPFDLIHLSKPRLPSVVVGLLYKLIWGASVIIDIDDEELAFVGSSSALPLGTALSEVKQPIDLKLPCWTELSVGMVSVFDATTVSNPALQHRYGGVIIPHARDENTFNPAKYNKLQQRQRLGIPVDKTVILFFGTPREHKGVLETAEALAALARDDYVYVIVGSFIDQSLKARLLSIESLNLILLPDQPYEHTAQTVAIADLCVLLQDAAHTASQFQLPAKLIDATAMGVTVMLEATAATQQFIDNRLAIEVNRDNLPIQLAAFLQHKLELPDVQLSRRFFMQHLSEEAMSRVVRSVSAEAVKKNSPLRWQAELIKAIAADDVLTFLSLCEQQLNVQ